MAIQTPHVSNLSKSRSIPLPSSETNYTKLLGGPPETVCMKSGCVVLAPGESVGIHNTGESEEIIVPLSGNGELHFSDMEPLQVCPGCVLYNPPHTAHDVVNTGQTPLKYIYIVTKTQFM